MLNPFAYLYNLGYASGQETAAGTNKMGQLITELGGVGETLKAFAIIATVAALGYIVLNFLDGD